jgi:hypothetical protein
MIEDEFDDVKGHLQLRHASSSASPQIVKGPIPDPADLIEFSFPFGITRHGIVLAACGKDQMVVNAWHRADRLKGQITQRHDMSACSPLRGSGGAGLAQ